MAGLLACHFTTNTYCARPACAPTRASMSVASAWFWPMWGVNTPVCTKQFCSSERTPRPEGRPPGIGWPPRNAGDAQRASRRHVRLRLTCVYAGPKIAENPADSLLLVVPCASVVRSGEMLASLWERSYAVDGAEVEVPDDSPMASAALARRGLRR